MQYHQPQPDFPEIIVEKAHPEQIPEVAEFMAFSNRDTYAEPLGLHPKLFETVTYRDQLENYIGNHLELWDSDLYLVALNGLMVGMIGARPDNNTVRIWGNRVATKQQGQRIGLFLMEIVTDEAKEKRIQNVSADINTITPRPTEFYSKLSMHGCKSDCELSEILPPEAPEQQYVTKTGNTLQISERIKTLMSGTPCLTVVS